MNANAFIGKVECPTEADVTAALGPAKAVWDQLQADLRAAGCIDRSEWSSYSVKHGWALRVWHKKRTIVWLSPHAGAFSVAVILGPKAEKAARAAKLPQKIVAALDAAPKYPEGLGVRLEVRSAKDLAGLTRLAEVKQAN